MKAFLEKIRTPEKGGSPQMQVMTTIGILLFGFALGILQKWMDGTPDNDLPFLIQQLDIRNYFGRLAVWGFYWEQAFLYIQNLPCGLPSTRFRFLSACWQVIISTAIIF